MWEEGAWWGKLFTDLTAVMKQSKEEDLDTPTSGIRPCLLKAPLPLNVSYLRAKSSAHEPLGNNQTKTGNIEILWLGEYSAIAYHSHYGPIDL